MWVYKFKFDGGLRKWDQAAAAAAALSSSMMQFKLQVIARILFWTLNNICIYIYIYGQIWASHDPLNNTQYQRTVLIIQLQKSECTLAQFQQHNTISCCLLAVNILLLNSIVWGTLACHMCCPSFCTTLYLKGSYSLHILWNMWDKQVHFLGYAMNK